MCRNAVFERDAVGDNESRVIECQSLAGGHPEVASSQRASYPSAPTAPKKACGAYGSLLSGKECLGQRPARLFSEAANPGDMVPGIRTNGVTYENVHDPRATSLQVAGV
jgi:hypothetical protein